MTDEASRINYRLRSTFFYRKLKEYKTLSLQSKIAALLAVKDLYSWEDWQNWGIGEDAFTYISNHPELQLIEVFCHPRLIREYSSLLAYYRNIAALPQKAVQYLAKINLKKIEADEENNYNLTEDKALALSRLFNEHISLIIDSSIASLTQAELYGILLASTGSQIDGSWRNAIGEEAEKVVQRLLIKEVKERNLLAAFIPRKITELEAYNPHKIEELLGNIEAYRGVKLANHTSILFSKEPDVSFFNNQGITVGVIEVKGGTDPAGTLERYGAAKKSFEEALRINPAVTTILIASCITPEVNNRIQNDPTISAYFNLTEILDKESQIYDQFIEKVFSLLHK
ncbi:XcyI family restriction endonuclease [Sphaerospermopsis aphanizomenoides BCCUSP55]|uniref:XcyI family restriction endonuclease n=1 Tax=Sphaerospermopsis aphanizomenoides TaxID=459663 RepID=UPI00190465FB|nr:XcyI family restriction endonuclease [Sphaerospermopsis aphanizomenoides]MBK1989020.1 XcyI family restriction endonuclease [Sphaerospermopsis aphanizomenoides BCCUSP55]